MDNGGTELPSTVIEDSRAQSADQTSKIPLMDALQEAMLDIQAILPPSASTLALSLLASGDQALSGAGVSHRSAVEVPKKSST